MKNKLIIWDWNGTLLNDVYACVNSVNAMLKVRQMKLLNETFYKNVFTFPVQDYYKTIGFDFKQESFEKLAVEYIDLYKINSMGSPLQKGSREALEFFKSENYKQIIVSASEQLSLENQIEQRQISKYFDSIIGLNNIHAKSKLDNAINYLKASEQFDRITLIGDTFHDYEVANAIGAECALVQNGHQNLNRFNLESKALIIKDLFELTETVDSEILIPNSIKAKSN
ncbi:MAG: HAD family hydrolase [Bacteroidales bacterium]|nr:HAD family hydrolase [Bacteroidales bacterium]